MTYDRVDAAMPFVFDPALQDQWVQDQRLPAYRIAFNLGDQVSDLRGGGADRHVTLPDPTYYLP